jgi:hypothetical protein
MMKQDSTDENRNMTNFGDFKSLGKPVQRQMGPHEVLQPYSQHNVQ